MTLLTDDEEAERETFKVKVFVLVRIEYLYKIINRVTRDIL